MTQGSGRTSIIHRIHVWYIYIFAFTRRIHQMKIDIPYIDGMGYDGKYPVFFFLAWLTLTFEVSTWHLSIWPFLRCHPLWPKEQGPFRHSSESQTHKSLGKIGESTRNRIYRFFVWEVELLGGFVGKILGGIFAYRKIGEKGWIIWRMRTFVQMAGEQSPTRLDFSWFCWS